jgi:hypothetical protein
MPTRRINENWLRHDHFPCHSERSEESQDLYLGPNKRLGEKL